MYIQDLIAKTHPSRISLTYATSVNGEPEVIDLPFRMLVLGDFSQGASTRPFKPLEERTPQRLVGSNLDALLAEQSLNLDLTVPDRITALPYRIQVQCTTGGPLGTAAFSINGKAVTSVGPAAGAARTWSTPVDDANATTTLAFDDDDGEFRQGDSWVVTPVATVIPDHENIGAGVLRLDKVVPKSTIRVRVPLHGMSSFAPDEVANSVPTISALRTLRKLLLEAQADLDNHRSLRTKLNSLLGDAGLRTSLRKALARGSLVQLTLLPPNTPPTAIPDPNPNPNPAPPNPNPAPPNPNPAPPNPNPAPPNPNPAPPNPNPAPPNPAPPAAPVDPIDLAAFDPVFAVETDVPPPPAPTTLTATSAPDDVLKLLLQDAGYTAVPAMPALSASLDELSRPSIGSDVHFVARLAALLANVFVPAGRGLNKARVIDAIALIDQLVSRQLDEILHHDTFTQLASAWGAVANLVENVEFSDQIWIDLLDVSQKELQDDFDGNQSDIFSGALFKKVYIDEYDQYGGVPYGAMIGLYEFENLPAHIRWLRQMAKVANASHAPFLAAVGPGFFGGKTVDDVAAIKDVRGLLGQPQYGDFSDLRDQPEAAYLGLALPRFMLRSPWNADTNPADGLPTYSEYTDGTGATHLWGNAAILVARNLIRSFNDAGWCQYIRGPKGGGRINGLPAVFYQLHDRSVFVPPVEITIPDYREFEFAESGFIPLVYRKTSVEATFFSVQSVKRAARFRDPKSNQNAQLVTNLAYTFSITRIAHYVKSIMRDNIGAAADAPYIQRVLSSWIADYVTEVTTPDDLTVERFPFKAASVTVTASPRDVGRYDCTIAVLPHVQFEGMNVTLLLESRLGK